MKTIALVLAAIASLSALVSLAVYAFLASKARVMDINRAFDDWQAKRWHKALIVLAGIAFATCVYQGVDALLWWLPLDIGGRDEFGDFHPLRGTISTAFTLFVGGSLAQLIMVSPELSLALLESAYRRKGLEQIIRAGGDPETLERLASEFDREAERLVAERPRWEERGENDGMKARVNRELAARARDAVNDGRRAIENREWREKRKHG